MPNLAAVIETGNSENIALPVPTISLPTIPTHKRNRKLWKKKNPFTTTLQKKKAAKSNSNFQKCDTELFKVKMNRIPTPMSTDLIPVSKEQDFKFSQCKSSKCKLRWKKFKEVGKARRLEAKLTQSCNVLKAKEELPNLPSDCSNQKINEVSFDVKTLESTKGWPILCEQQKGGKCIKLLLSRISSLNELKDISLGEIFERELASCYEVVDDSTQTAFEHLAIFSQTIAKKVVDNSTQTVTEPISTFSQDVIGNFAQIALKPYAVSSESAIMRELDCVQTAFEPLATSSQSVSRGSKRKKCSDLQICNSKHMKLDSVSITNVKSKNSCFSNFDSVNNDSTTISETSEVKQKSSSRKNQNSLHFFTTHSTIPTLENMSPVPFSSTTSMLSDLTEPTSTIVKKKVSFCENVSTKLKRSHSTEKSATLSSQKSIMNLKSRSVSLSGNVNCHSYDKLCPTMFSKKSPKQNFISNNDINNKVINCINKSNICWKLINNKIMPYCNNFCNSIPSDQNSQNNEDSRNSMMPITICDSTDGIEDSRNSMVPISICDRTAGIGNIDSIGERVALSGSRAAINSCVSIVSIRNNEGRMAVRNNNGRLAVKNNDSRVAIRNNDSRVAVNISDNIVPVRNNESRVAVKNTDSREEDKNNDSRVAVNVSDNIVSVKNNESRVAVNNNDSRVAVKNNDSRVTVKNNDGVAVRNNDSRVVISESDSSGDSVHNNAGSSSSSEEYHTAVNLDCSASTTIHNQIGHPSKYDHYCQETNKPIMPSGALNETQQCCKKQISQTTHTYNRKHSPVNCHRTDESLNLYSNGGEGLTADIVDESSMNFAI